MRPIRWRTWRAVDNQHSEKSVFALVLMATMASGACWLDRGIVDLPPVQQDAGASVDTGSGGCKWVAGSATSCTLTDVSCGQRTACPPSWMQANSPGSCPEVGATLLTETCEGLYRWSLASSNGTLVAACYYDKSTGLLAGIDSQIPFPCGTNRNQFGTIPQLCHYDAGVEIQRITCAAAGSGDQTDGAHRRCRPGLPGRPGPGRGGTRRR